MLSKVLLYNKNYIKLSFRTCLKILCRRCSLSPFQNLFKAFLCWHVLWWPDAVLSTYYRPKYGQEDVDQTQFLSFKNIDLSHMVDFYFSVVVAMKYSDNILSNILFSFLMQYPYRFSKAAFKADFHLMIDALSHLGIHRRRMMMD